MAVSGTGTRCLSVDEHEPPRDSGMHLQHVLGCLEFCDRQAYLDELAHQDDRGVHICERIYLEVERIKYLRAVLKSAEDEPVDGPASHTGLVGNLERSMKAWRECDLYLGKSGIDRVREWRRFKGLLTDLEIAQEPDETEASEPPDYDPDDDVKAYLLSYHKNGTPVYSVKDVYGDDCGLEGSHFPDQKIAMSRLLMRPSPPGVLPIGAPQEAADGLVSRLHSKGDAGYINYLHLPANNMAWVEETIKLYFKEDRDPGVLSPQFWNGQQLGGQSAEIHARHLRPMCEMVPSDLEVDKPHSNMVLFMPYLHWETDRQRENIAHLIDREEEKHRKERDKTELDLKRERQAQRAWLSNRQPDAPSTEEEQPSHGILKTFAQVVIAKQYHPPRSPTSSLFKSLFMSKNGRVLTSAGVSGNSNLKAPLGQVLIDAARLYEAITNHRDKMLIQKYLYNGRSPLHPRRTLDQAYYSTLKTTRARDRDQVVYRGTRPDPVHSFYENGKWDCPHLDGSQETGDKVQKECDTQDSEMFQDQFCKYCANNHVRKVARIVMVDQLWMWILDDTTIITAFPKRYGVNKQDSSGLHNSIRVRLKNLKRGHIKTVFDLALIILDELTKVFFDRWKTADEQPEVLHIFSETIGNTNNRQTLCYDHLWDWTRDLAKVASPEALHSDLAEFVAPLLNISIEGGLQREIKDVIDELSMMIFLQKQQLEVIELFKSHAIKLLAWAQSDDQNSNSPANSPTSLSISPISFSHPNTQLLANSIGLELRKNPPSKEIYWFTRMSEDLVKSVKTGKAELEALKLSAKSTSESLENLLSLKQQQVSVVQAWQSVQQSEEAAKQGRAIMTFTVITIVFLPLAFIASIFGMNNKQIAGDDAPMTLRQQFGLMFPISTGIIAVVLVFAYSFSVRTLVWLAYRYLVTLLLVKTSLYDRAYLILKLDWTESTKKAEENVRDMKLNAKKKMRQRYREEQQEMRRNREAADAKQKQEDEEKATKEDEHRQLGSGQQNPRRQADDTNSDTGALVGNPHESNGTSIPGQSSLTGEVTAPLSPHILRFVRAQTAPPSRTRDPELGGLNGSSNPRRTSRLSVAPTLAMETHGVQTTPSLMSDEMMAPIGEDQTHG